MDPYGFDARTGRPQDNIQRSGAEQRRMNEQADSVGSFDQQPAPSDRAAVQYGGNRGTITSRPSRESILRSYASQDAARARSARMHAQEASQSYQESSLRARQRAANRQMLENMRREEEQLQAEMRKARREIAAANARTETSLGGRPHHTRETYRRTSEPLTSKQSYDNTQMSREAYERARASRDVLSSANRGRTTHREVIDGRGSIDSRAFNEYHQLVGYSIDERDRPAPLVDASNPKAKWRSQAGQGFGKGAEQHGGLFQHVPDLGKLSDAISGHDSYSSRGSFLGNLPLFVKVVVPIVVVLLIILLVILFL